MLSSHSRRPGRSYALGVVLVLVASLAACDSEAPAPASAAGFGPAKSEFPQDALFTSDTVDDLVIAQTAASFGATADTVVIVPLVFAPNGYLYTPLGYNTALQEALDAQGPESGTPDPDIGETYFTDLATFEEVLASGGSSQVYYSRKKGPASELSSDSDVYVRPMDPYSCSTRPEDCPGARAYNPNQPPPQPPVPPSTGGGTPSRQIWSSGTTAIGATPTMSNLWKGDILSGGLRNINPFGHTSIVTRLSNFQNTGGSLANPATLVMEAAAEGSNHEEVAERPARAYWIDGNRPIRNLVVLFMQHMNWAERDEAISYARAQDPDTYSLLTPKIDRRWWYCSKLVWRAYRKANGVDLDHDWGYYVFPGDIESSAHLSVVYRFRTGS